MENFVEIVYFCGMFTPIEKIYPRIYEYEKLGRDSKEGKRFAKKYSEQLYSEYHELIGLLSERKHILGGNNKIHLTNETED